MPRRGDFFVFTRSVREQEGEQEHEAEDRRNRTDLFDFTRAELDDRIGEEARRNTVRDGIGKAHHRDGEECGNSRCGIFPVDVRNVTHHEYADIHESACRCAGRNERRDGAEEHSDRKQNSDDQGGKARSAAFRYACRRFDEGRDGGSTEDRARAGCDGVAKERSLDVFHFARFIEQAAFFAGRLASSHQGTDGIEHIDHCKRDERRDKVKDLRATYTFKPFNEYLSKGFRTKLFDFLNGIFKFDCIENRFTGCRTCSISDSDKDVVQDGTADDTKNHRPANIQFGENSDHK